MAMDNGGGKLGLFFLVDSPWQIADSGQRRGDVKLGLFCEVAFGGWVGELGLRME